MEVIMKYEMFDSNNRVQSGGIGQRVMGGFYIVVGILVLLGTTGVTILGFSPWILLAFLPVFLIGQCAYRLYKIDGRISTRVVLVALISLLPFVFVGASMLGFPVWKLWPVGIIAVGVMFMISGD
jgi:hypothetical protein